MADFDFIIYHSPSDGGFAAAYVAWRYFRALGRLDQVTFHGMRRDDPFPDLTGRRVLMLDIAPKSAELTEMLEVCDRMLILDHRATTREELGDKFDCVGIDVETSCVMMTWDYFFHDEGIPDFLWFIGLRDIGRHESVPKADAFTRAFRGEPNFEYWDLFARFPALVREHIILGYDELFI